MISGKSYRLVVTTLTYLVLSPQSCEGQLNNQFKNELKASKPCKYKVWFLEICEESDKMQLVHLILEDGDMTCDITKHVREPCTPSKENDHPVMPKNAIFKDLLLSENHTKLAIETYLNKTDVSQIPLALHSNSSQRENAIQVLIKELDIFEKQEDKTLHSHDPVPKDGHQHEKYRKLDSTMQSKVIKQSDSHRSKSSRSSSENQGATNESQDSDGQDPTIINADYSQGSIFKSKNRPRFEKAQFPVRSYLLRKTKSGPQKGPEKSRMVLPGASEPEKMVNISQDLKASVNPNPPQNISDSESTSLPEPSQDSTSNPVISSGTEHLNDSSSSPSDPRLRSTMDKDVLPTDNSIKSDGNAEVVHGRVVIDGIREDNLTHGAQFIKGQGNGTKAEDSQNSNLTNSESGLQEFGTSMMPTTDNMAQKSSILELLKRTRPHFNLHGQSNDLQLGPKIPIMLGDPRFKHPSMKVRIEAERVKQEDEGQNSSNIEQKLMKFISAANLDIPGDDLVKIQTLLKHINSSVASEDEKKAMLDIVKEMENTIRQEMEEKGKSKEPEKTPRTIMKQNILKGSPFQKVPPSIPQQTMATSSPDPRRPNIRGLPEKPEVQQKRRVNDLVQEVGSLTDTLSADLGQDDQLRPRGSPPPNRYYPNKEKLLESLRTNISDRNDYFNKMYEPSSKPDPYRPSNGFRSLRSENYKTTKVPYENKAYKKTYTSTKYTKKQNEKSGSTSELSDSDKSFFEGPRWKTAPINASKVINWYIQNMPQGRQTIIVL